MDCEYINQSTNIEHKAGFVLWKLSNLWQRYMNQILEELNLTHTQSELLIGIFRLQKKAEIVTQISLANFTNINIMLTSQVLRILEKKGFVTRSTHPQDTRAKCLVLTEKGLNIAHQAKEKLKQASEHFFRNVQEKEVVLKILTQLLYDNKISD